MPEPYQRRNYDAVKSALLRQLVALNYVLIAPANPPTPIPRAVAIELQHMLAHLLLASECEVGDYATRTSQVVHALGHLDRAMLDACKILIEKNFFRLSQNITFLKEWIDLRQREGGNHFRGQASFINNPTCDRFYTLLQKYCLIRHEETPTTTNSNEHLQGNTWQRYIPELHRWFRRELLCSSLCGKKNLDALAGMLQSFWTLDNAKLCLLNKRLELDIIITNAAQALAFGWDSRPILQAHVDFLRNYQAGQCAEAEINQNYTTWVRRSFTSLLHFYGQDWPD